MGVKTIDSNGGFAKFGKGDNVYLKPAQIDTGYNDYQDEPQLECTFLAVPTDGGEQGQIPGYLSSKITIQEDDNFSSNLGKLLIAADKLEAVLADLGLDDETIEAIKNGEMRYEAETESENTDLYSAVVTHLSQLNGFVVKGGTKYNKGEDFSKVNDIYGRVDEDPFAETGDAAESDSDAESADAESSDLV